MRGGNAATICAQAMVVVCDIWVLSNDFHRCAPCNGKWKMENGKYSKPRRFHARGASTRHGMTLGAVAHQRPLCALAEIMKMTLYNISMTTNYKFGLTLIIRCGNMGGAHCVRHRLLSVT